MTSADIELVRLPEVDRASLSRLVNDPRVRRHMPLTGGEMSEAEIGEWIVGKERIWEDHGFGPWGVRIGGEFAGWGGLQPWDDEVEVALVLKPELWGWGRPIFERFVEHAFEHLALTHVLAAVPPTRGKGRGLLRLGFSFVGTATVEGQAFLVYRLDRESWPVGRGR